MKVTNLRRKLVAALAAAGMLTPGVIRAANLDTNLLANPGFELVDTNVHPPGTNPGELVYQDPLILNWGGTRQGFAYSHDGSNGAFNYANGSPLATGGHYYFTANAVPNDFVPPGDIDAAGQLFQDIDVSAGASRTLIDTGTARYNVSGFFNTFETNNDIGHVHLNFLDGSNASLGTAEVVAQGPLSSWVPNSTNGLIPAATRTVRVSIFGVANAGGPDGYIDNVDFRVTSGVFNPTLAISVDRNTGTVTLSNNTGAAVNLKSYQIASAFEALNPNPANWKSIADNYDAGSPGPNQVDATHNWTKLTDPAANTDISEADLESGFGASLANGRTVSLGNAGTWIATPTEDLTFEYISGTQIVRGVVTYTGNGGQALSLGDLDANGSINSADWAILRANQHANLSGQSFAEAYRLGDLNGDHLNNHADFAAFKTAYDAANGAGAFVAMLAAVPEPATVWFVLAVGTFVLPMCRRRAADKQQLPIN